MIHKNIKYGNITDVIVAEFGKGTLSVVNGVNPQGHLALFIKTKKFTPIGEVSGSDKNSDDFKPELVLAFNNYVSFEIFYGYVENIREQFFKQLAHKQGLDTPRFCKCGNELTEKEIYYETCLLCNGTVE